MEKTYVFPFVAVIGQEKIKRALILNLINPLIGGVLISGEKGNAKSTLVRGLAELMHSLKVVEIPLNVTEDRLIGTIDIQKAIIDGEINYEAGILKRADGNFLYVDEVNLLSENIVNSLLDVSSSKINHVEREGISYTHKSNFVLVGTMNPEEGNLRSQFLDRFGLYVDVKGIQVIEDRKEIIKRRLEYDNNPVKYIEKWQKESNKLYDRIICAKNCLEKIEVSENMMKLAAELSIKANCQGHRAEIIIIETAKAIAAFDNRTNICNEDIYEAAGFALAHRIRELPPKTSNDEGNKDKKSNKQNNNEKENENQDERKNNNEHEIEQEENKSEDNINFEYNEKETDNDDKYDSNIDDIGSIFSIKPLNIDAQIRKIYKGSGKRSKTKTNLKQGRYVKYRFTKEKVNDIAFDATIRAAAPYQRIREKNNLAISIDKNDFRVKMREKRIGSTILFIVDASGSMGVKKRMTEVKGAILSLLTDAYQKRDKVGMIAFKKKDAEILLEITRSVELAQKSLRVLPTGGKTPLAVGLSKGYEIIKANMRKDPDMLPVIVLVTDGRANSSLDGGDAFREAINMAIKINKSNIQSLVIDTEQGFVKLGLAKQIANAMNSKYYSLGDLAADKIVGAVKESMIM